MKEGSLIDKKLVNTFVKKRSKRGGDTKSKNKFLRGHKKIAALTRALGATPIHESSRTPLPAFVIKTEIFD